MAELMISDKVSSTKELVTPAKAKEWFENCNIENNRFVSSRVVDRYVHDMKTKKWKDWSILTFTDTGKLIDGQHRLNAVFRSGLPQWFLVVRGVDESTIEVLDTGKPRNAANISKLNGRNFSQAQVSCFNSMCLAPGASQHLLLNLSHIQRLDLMEEIRDGIEFACKEVGKKKGVLFLKNSATDAAVARAYYHENRQRLELFREIVRTGYGSTGPQDESAIALRDEFLKTRPSYAGQKKTIYYSRTELFLLSQVALNHFLRYNSVTSLRLPKSPKSLWKVSVIDDFKKTKGDQ